MFPDVACADAPHCRILLVRGMSVAGAAGSGLESAHVQIRLRVRGVRGSCSAARLWQ
jgi:hypothetical protein